MKTERVDVAAVNNEAAAGRRHSEPHRQEKAIGGYFELELNEGNEYHPNAIRLNTGRNALEYILRAKRYRKVYVPYYTCEVVLQPISKLGIKYQFYHVDSVLEPCFDYSAIQDDEAFLYPNYFGLKDRCVETLAQTCRNLIVDNAQSFFSLPFSGVDTFYSPRKFFGLPDGAYLYTDTYLDHPLEQDRSESRIEHLIARIEYGPEHGYPAFTRNSRALDMLPIRKMSSFTRRMLMNIDYVHAAGKRRANFLRMHDEFGSINTLKLDLTDSAVPMVYPLRVDSEGLRQSLIESRVFVAQYWPNVMQWTLPSDPERDLAAKIVPLPIDQRYSLDDMERVLCVIRGAL